MSVKLRYKHEDVVEMGREKGFELIEPVYKGFSAPHLYRCEEGHEWLARPSNIFRGFGCPSCWNKRRKGQQRYRIEVYRKKAEVLGGVCLSEESDIEDSKSKLQFRCSEGHEWTSSGQSILRGSWCKRCAISKMSDRKAAKRLLFVESIASEKKGCCIGPAKVGKYRYVLVCAAGHSWETSFTKIKTGTWCKQCAVNAPLDLLTLQEAAKSKGGICLAETVPKSHEKVFWECSVGHRWKATPSHILHSGTWCPLCGKKYRSENFCRVILEQILGITLPPSRPDWLGYGPRGGRLELDGLNEERGFAFEYNGNQHFEIDGFFIRNEADLKARQSTDKIKRERCLERKIVLIDVGEFPAGADLDVMVRHISAALEVTGWQLPPEGFDLSSFDISKVYPGTRVERLFQAISLNKGTLLGQYINDHTQVLLRCEAGHTWSAFPQSIKRGSWCAKCSGIRRGLASRNYSIFDLHALARSRGGECLDDQYQGASSHYRWKCDDPTHEIWTANFGNILRGKWCPRCGIIKAGDTKRMKNIEKFGVRNHPKPISLEEHRRVFKMKGLAKVGDAIAAKGGVLVGGDYANSRSKLFIRCEKGHQFETKAIALMKSDPTWCPYCSGRGKTIFDLAAIARSKGGECISTDYLGMDVHHRWQCDMGHQWDARPANIQQGGWCPECAHKKKKTIEEMRQIASERGGRCLSTEYKGAFEHLEWECGTCHNTWFAMPTNIQRGKWCPPCARERASKKRRKV